MKVLIVHNTYQHAGGEDVVAMQEAGLLRRMGHEVLEYRRSNHEISRSKLSTLVSLKATLWSSKSYRELQGLIKDQRPQLAHFHNTFMLISPAAYYACRRSGVPVVQTLHNYRLLCPRADFSRNHSICELCLGRTPWPGILHRCYHDSWLQTSAVVAMLVIHRRLKTWQEQVDVFIAPTEFVRQKALQGGISAGKVVVKPHFVYPDPGGGTRSSDYALFVGRLSREKGIVTLLEAWKSLSGLKLKLVGSEGDGSKILELLRARELPDVEVLGECSRDCVASLMKKSVALIFPSTLYETFGLSIIESFSCGVPVIASRLGAMAEIVRDGSTGLLFKAGDASDLAEKVRWAFHHRDEMARMGISARRTYLSDYTAEKNYNMLMTIYDRALAESSIPASLNSDIRPAPGF